MPIWTPAADRVPGCSWETAGLSSPIPEYTNLFDITDYGADPTDNPSSVATNDAAIAAALAALSSAGLPNSALYAPKIDASTPGIYHVTYVLYSTNSGGFGFVGDGQFDDESGTWATQFSAHGGPCMVVGQTPGYVSPGEPGGSPYATFSGGKGDDQITVTYGPTSDPFVVGKIARVSAGYDPVLPATSGNGLVERSFPVRVTAVAGNVLTLSRNLPYDVASGTITQGILNTSYRMRFEGFRLRANSNQVGYDISESEDIELRNLRVDGHNNYGIRTAQPIGLHVHGCWVGEAAVAGSNHAGILSNGVMHGLWANNIVELNFPCWEINFCTTATVFRDNFSVKGGFGLDMDINHGAQNTTNLYQHNLVSTLITEGYHGGDDRSVIFSNWITGRAYDGTESSYTYSAKRFSYKNILANCLLSHPDNVTIPSPFRQGYGGANIGNGASFGSASSRSAKGTLTTRTSDTAGIITADSASHDVTTGQSLLIAWVIGNDVPGKTTIGRRMTVGTVSGTSIPVSGGAGDVLPDAGTVVHFPTTNPDAYAWWYDWDAALGQPRYWTGVLTTRDMAAAFDTFTADAGTNVLTTSGAHGRFPYDEVMFTTTDTLPGGLATNTRYYVKETPSSTTLTLAPTVALSSEVDITTAGTGTHSIHLWNSTSGVVTLDTGQGATIDGHFKRAQHDMSSTSDGTCGMGGAGIFVTIDRVSVVGDVLTFDTASLPLMPEGTSVTLTPSALGFQEHDVQVWLDAEEVGNYNFVDNEIPEIQALPAGTTFPDSLAGDDAPDYYTGVGTFPPFKGSDSSTADPNRLPAYVRYTSFLPLEAPEFTSDVIISGSGAEGSTLTSSGGPATGNPTPTYTFQWQVDDGGGFDDIPGETGATYDIPLSSGYVGFSVRVHKHAQNSEGFDDSYSNEITITPFMGDVLLLNQTTNSSPVTELVKRATVGGGAPTEEIIQHSSDYPSQPDNNYVYAKHGSTQKHVFVFEGTITLAEALASRP